MGGIKGETQKWDVVSWRWLDVHLKSVLCVHAHVCCYLCVHCSLKKIIKILALAHHIFPFLHAVENAAPPLGSSLLFLYFSSLSSFECFSAPIQQHPQLLDERIKGQLRVISAVKRIMVSVNRTKRLGSCSIAG